MILCKKYDITHIPGMLYTGQVFIPVFIPTPLRVATALATTPDEREFRRQLLLLEDFTKPLRNDLVKGNSGQHPHSPLPAFSQCN